MNICACLGRMGTDPYCPCTMKHMGLTSCYNWSKEDKQRLYDALYDVFQSTPESKPVIKVINEQSNFRTNLQ